MRSPVLASVSALALFLGLTVPASATWAIRTLTNQTNQTLGVSYPIGPGGRLGSNTMSGGDAVIAVPGHGIVTFKDMGHNTPCSRPYWGVAIKYKGQQWGLFYDGGGTVDVTINADGSLSMVGGPASVVVAGSGPPPCTQ